MSILVIGQSAFLASQLPLQEKNSQRHFIGHNDALGAKNWPEDITCVINFAFDPVIREGKFSDLDHQYAKIADKIGAHYIMLSSRAVYGLTNTPTTISEDHKPFEIITPYGHAKKLIEQDLVKNFERLTILRLSNIFGFEYDSQKPRPTFMGLLLKTLKKEGVIRFSMNPLTQRDFLPLELFTSQLITIAQQPETGTFNLGSGFGTNTGDIANWVIEGYGKGDILTSSSKHSDNYILNMNKSRTTFSLPPIEDGIVKQRCIEIGKKLKET